MRGPRRPQGTPPASRVLPVRLPVALGHALDDRARTERLTAGTIARQAIVAYVDAEPGLTVPIRRYRATRPAPSIDTVRLAEMRESVGEAVGTLRQVAGIDRERGGARLHEIDDALDQLLQAVAALDDWKEATMRAVDSDEGIP